MTILHRIVADTKELIRSRKAEVSTAQLESRPGYARTPTSLDEALRAPGLSYISEIKKASPSKGVIRPDFQPAVIARQYDEAGTAAISVLTEPLHFQGSLEILAAVREVTSLPLLRKDFIVDPYQLVEARAFGADAVLFIAAVLDHIQLRDLLTAAGELGLSALVEIYELEELGRIDFDQVSILGVNNRDLRTFEVDVDHSLRVFRHVPEGIVRVSESGLSSADELRRLSARGIDAVLIGETFMRADDPGRALGELMRAADMIEEG